VLLLLLLLQVGQAWNTQHTAWQAVLWLWLWLLLLPQQRRTAAEALDTCRHGLSFWALMWTFSSSLQLYCNCRPIWLQHLPLIIILQLLCGKGGFLLPCSSSGLLQGLKLWPVLLLLAAWVLCVLCVLCGLLI
jgi:hypothetical protein